MRCVEGVQQSLADCQLAPGQRIELRRGVGFLQDRAAFAILVHSQQRLFEAFRRWRSQVAPDRNQMSRVVQNNVIPRPASRRGVTTIKQEGERAERIPAAMKNIAMNKSTI